ncbi:phytanoyl-CoA dioxygenase family protein [Sandaracinobacteroides saxicola]|uniref:Phytanoyl-CoA dioxygenase family protein n=1 Tax=Sandaracinobacteroides saxicola TaxID=2759707 RepID=A0A7G5IED0_9SPHN|nr:phytanoyl-CoA dioxygenase family protein [Sandaracinobacteroides saxicola]QMW21722.1 phytanoyl-CoA dioxygenase family protein [Sandaracinobacteroides saxicola]
MKKQEKNTVAMVEAFRRDGYAIVRGLFSMAEVAAIGAAMDAIHAEGMAHGRSYRHGNLFYNVLPGTPPDGAPRVRMVQWPAYHNAAMAALRIDPRWVELLQPLIGRDLKQIIHQLHWKARGVGTGGDFAWHQDSRSRRPAWAYRNLATSYVQTGLAVDPHTAESGCLRVVRGSHRHGDLAMRIDGEVLGQAVSDEALRAVGLDPADTAELLLEPGDVALWSPYLVHASGTNVSGHARRLVINGYVRAEDCDRGEWAFRNGVPVPLAGEPALVHYEALREAPGPFYP